MVLILGLSQEQHTVSGYMCHKVLVGQQAEEGEEGPGVQV